MILVEVETMTNPRTGVVLVAVVLWGHSAQTQTLRRSAY